MAGLVPRGVSACDVGCDHGFVAIHLVREHICPGVIAMDINRGPLLRAREHIESAGLSAYIETRLSDGLEKLAAGETECMIAAGMGGRLIVKILEEYPEKRESLRYLVLQPQSELSCVRSYLRERNFVIRREDMVLEDEKFYPMMLAEAESPEEKTVSGEDGGGAKGARDKAAAGEKILRAKSLEDEFGPCLIRENHPVLSAYLDRWEQQQYRILAGVLKHPERRRQVEEELARIRDARKMMEAAGGRSGDGESILCEEGCGSMAGDGNGWSLRLERERNGQLI